MNIMNTSRRSVVIGLALLLCTSASKLSPQATTPDEAHCFAIHVRLNGKSVDDPKTITYKTKDNEQTVHLEGDCFKVPSDLLKEKTIDVFFTLPGSKVYLSSIPTGAFAGPWDVELADKRFARGVVLPKHIRARDACAVTFHVGDPETVSAMAPCRTPLPASPSTTH